MQALPRERQQVTIWSTRKMARPRAYTDRQDARKMSTTFLGGDDGMARPPSSSSSSSSSPTSSSSSSVAVADDGSVGAILYIGEASEIFELSRNSARTLQELSRNFPGTFQELFSNFPGTFQELTRKLFSQLLPDSCRNRNAKLNAFTHIIRAHACCIIMTSLVFNMQ